MAALLKEAVFFQGAWLAYLVEYAALDLEVMSSSQFFLS